MSLTLDRKAGMPVFVYSSAGGMSIEDVAHKSPELIHKLHVNTKKGLEIESLLKAAKDLGLEDNKT